MTTFTDDDKKLIKEIKERISSLEVRDDIERRAYEIALASLEAEPVAWLHSDNGLGIPAITRSKNIADSWLFKELVCSAAIYSQASAGGARCSSVFK
ncbi:TPA: hypothetical protein M2G79_005434 [Escherichia coli]|nr:hypothetical protein [Escherichia coli]EIH5092303.1 hypothetical protein [Escherichia coli]EIH8950300.1 hypothetical protein [Escherichia coli]HCB8433223.1 hypothetical protein [Escherichia coli]HCB8464564.1 hypothetical protein [Escherichia coli]